ncbi:MAG: response regulator transcription factor, partial [Dehalococcoidia bacterium]
QALMQAKSQGPNRVLPAGWLPGQEALPETVDVLLVDDDETLASLLLHALENRGYTTRWLQDGLETVEALGGPNPTLRASLVLLDVDLPGMDGIGVLRQLARERIVGQTRIIMVTKRTSEEEVLTCLELGAFDHISKPFSVPVLLQRIKGALKIPKGDV